MTVLVSYTSVDCVDAYALSAWWQQALGYVDSEDDPNEPGDPECMIHDPVSAHRLLFVEVPDPTPGKNKLHLDVRPRSRTQEAEVAVLVDQGATVVADRRGQHGPGTGWVTLADPEGNQFCVLRPEAE